VIGVCQLINKVGGGGGDDVAGTQSHSGRSVRSSTGSEGGGTTFSKEDEALVAAFMQHVGTAVIRCKQHDASKGEAEKVHNDLKMLRSQLGEPR
jgi:hypothetical protein